MSEYGPGPIRRGQAGQTVEVVGWGEVLALSQGVSVTVLFVCAAVCPPPQFAIYAPFQLVHPPFDVVGPVSLAAVAKFDGHSVVSLVWCSDT